MSQGGANNFAGGGGGGNLNTLTPDVGGTVSPVFANINIHGTTGITTTNTGAASLTISGILQTRNITLTSTQVKNLGSTPITVIPGQGAGTVIVPYVASTKLVVPTGDAFTDPSSSSGILSYYNGVNAFDISTILQAPEIIANVTTYQLALFQTATTFTSPQVEGLPVVINNLNTGTNFAGNNSGNNTVVISVQYVVLTL